MVNTGDSIRLYPIGDEHFETLVEDIKKNGQMLPILVEKLPRKWWQYLIGRQYYKLLTGFRRVAAIKELKLKTINCQVI